MTKNEIRLFLHELESMPEYSTSIPTGQVMWKMWRRRERIPAHWVGGPAVNEFVGQYTPSDRRGFVRIRWFKVVLKYGPAPPVYHAPDWSNYERYKRLGYA